MGQGYTKGIPIDVDGTLAQDSDLLVPSQKAVKTYTDTGLALKENLSNKDTDGTLSANSDTKYPSQKAVKTYADTGLATKVGTTGNESIAGEKTFTNNATINDNSANPALKINQIGSGHSILVEDAATPDSTPFVVDNAGNVGVGTTAPTQKLEVIGNMAATIYYLPDTAKFISGGVGAVMTISSGTNSMVFKQTANAFMRGTTGGIGIEITGTPTIDASAILTLTSTTKGFLPPRMTTTQRDAITPVAGLMIYNTTTNKHQGYNGTTWNDFY